MADKNIESVLLEERTFPPARGFTARARLKPADLANAAASARARITSDSGRSWRAQELSWQTPFTVDARRQRGARTIAGSATVG